jgi:glycosyl transferase family 25
MIYFYIKEKFKNHIDFDNIYIYVIHKKKMTKRYDRLIEQLKKYFPKNNYQIIEPISLDIIKNSLSDYLKNNVITYNAFYNIYKNNKVYRGTHTLKSLSLALTNINIWKNELKKNRYFMILEDDFQCRQNFLFIMTEILNHLPNNWDIIYLSCHLNKSTYSKKNIKNHLLPIISRTHGQGAVLYHPRSLNKILSNIFPLDLQIDHDIPDKLIARHKIKAYTAVNSDMDTIIRNDNLYYGSTTQK